MRSATWVLALVVLCACDGQTPVTGTDVESDGSCAQPHFMFESTVCGDECWAPPDHFCRGAYTSTITYACTPDLSLCCGFSTTCNPCGWVGCLPSAEEVYKTADGRECPDIARPRGTWPAECSAMAQAMREPVCYDDIPAERVDELCTK